MSGPDGTGIRIVLDPYGGVAIVQPGLGAVATFTAAGATAFALELIRRSNGLDEEQLAAVRTVVPIARAEDVAAAIAGLAADRGERGEVERLYAPHWEGGRNPVLQCGDGWLGILGRLLPAILELDPDVKVGRVAEQRGVLRVAVDSGSDDVWELVVAAAEESARTCGLCGAPGLLRQRLRFRPEPAERHLDDDIVWSTRCGGCRVPGWDRLGTAVLHGRGDRVATRIQDLTT